MIQVKQVLQCLEQAAPYELAESWDNVGLLVGDPEAEVEGARWISPKQLWRKQRNAAAI